MPLSGLPPFLQGLLANAGMDTEGFNALVRATSISTFFDNDNIITDVVFQCPCPGYLHFYVADGLEIRQVVDSFNALVRATSISTARTECAGK